MEIDGEETINHERNKKLAIITVVLLIIAAILIGAMVFLRWYQDDNKVTSDALSALISKEGIFAVNGANFKGKYELKTKTGADNRSIDFDLASTSERSQGVFDFDLQNGGNFKITAMYKADGTLYFMGENLKEFVKKSGGDKVEVCADAGECNLEDEEKNNEEEAESENGTEEEDDEKVNSSSSSFVDLAKYGKDMANLLEGNWYKIKIDELLTSEEVGDSSCLANSLKNIRADLSDDLLKKAYNQNAFLSVDRVEVNSSDTSSSIYIMKIDKNKLADFMNVISHRDAFIKFAKCRGEDGAKKFTVDDFDFKNDTRMELSISKWQHKITHFKMNSSLENGSTVIMESDINLGVQMPTEEPTEFSNKDKLREDIEAGLKGGMKQMYAVLANSECPKRGDQVVQACKEQVIAQGDKTIGEFKFKFPLSLDSIKF